MRKVQIGSPPDKSHVPASSRMGTFLSPQAVSAVDFSDDGQFIAVGTMAFRNDRNFFVLSASDGKVTSARYIEPWAPAQVAAIGKGEAFAAGMAYARQTEPFPVVSLFRDEKKEVAAVEDVGWDRGCLRYGSGDWRTGWSVSLMGDLFVHGPGRLFTITTNNNQATTWTGEGAPQRCPADGPRPFRLAMSGDGRIVASGHLVLNLSGLDSAVRDRLGPAPAGLLTVRDVEKSNKLWDVAPSVGVADVIRPPEPADDFPALADDFHMKPQALVPFRIAASVAANTDGSRVAIAEYGGWLRLRREPLIGYWRGHGQGVNFCPRQRGRLRVFGEQGKTLAEADLPREGLFDVHLSPAGDRVWCIPASWFARGSGGCAWLPTDSNVAESANEIYVYDILTKGWTQAFRFPDTISDVAIHPGGDRILVSCWDGNVFLLGHDGAALAKIDVGGPGRITWDREGKSAVVGTQGGEVLSLDADGKAKWKIALPVAAAQPAEKPLKPVFEEVPVYSVARVGPEHAYVGDTWLIKTAEGGILVDVGGTSGIPITLERIRAAGVDPKEIRYVLITHSHGDHCGAAYLWRSRGAEIVAPASAAYAMTWVPPGWSGYSVWPPCPIDRPLDLKKPADETEFTLCGVRIKAIFAPGHSIDSVIYAVELNGRRVIFTGDIAFDDRGPGRPLGSNILHRSWADRAKAESVIQVIQGKVLPLKPEFEFKGHASHRDATAVWQNILRASHDALKAGETDGKK